jgi:hypothetical protein
MSRRLELLCTLDIAQTAESFHAHAIPEDVEIGPGDMILVHDAPGEISFGEVYAGERRATLTRATALERLWTKFRSMFEITELFEVGFQPIGDVEKG